jgi:creatinine amidohydrolase
LPIYALPPVCYGKSNEHIGFPGTLSVSAQTFLAVVRDLGASIAASGFKKAGPLQHAWRQHIAGRRAGPRSARGVRPAHLLALRLAGAAFEGVSKQERTYGFHAGEIETAFLLHATPELVHPDEYTRTTLRASMSRSCSSPKALRQTSPGSPETLRPAA